MRVLVCSDNAPRPPIGGKDLRCWQTLNLLHESVDVGLFALNDNRHPPPPGFDPDVWRVTGSAKTPLNQQGWMKRDAGLPSDAYYDEASAGVLRKLLQDFAPDVVVLDHLFIHSYEAVVRDYGCRVVLNAHNVEAALARELADSERNGPVKLQRRVFATRVAKLEAELANRMDQIWVCSEQDRDAFLEDYGVRVPVYVVPNAIELATYRARGENHPRELDGLTGPLFLFTGTFNYAPNQRAADLLIHDLFPMLARVYPESRLLLVGKDPTHRMLAAAEMEKRIIVTGWVPDAIPYLQRASIMLVPLFEGGGTRFKILEAFAAGLPVVSTAKGAEGLGAEPGKHFLLAEEPEDFLGAIEQILTDENRRVNLVNAGTELVEKFSWTAARQIIGQALRQLEP